jgi:Holliday junction resolvasome RuvABC DNA-binding subunit
MELKDKLGDPGASASAGGELLAREALVELGWSLIDAERALSDVDDSLSVEEQIRSALKKAA